MLICISGSSGVGKTTLAKLFEAVLGSSSTVLLSGDDLHKWERMDPRWQSHTHLDPKANNLDVGFLQLIDLIEGREVQRRKYNHHTGTFDPAVTVRPKQHLIYEGLHALWDTDTVSLADVCIFVDTDNVLKTEWKVKRDTKSRGYTKQQVLDTMLRRSKDEELFIIPQRRNADIVVRFSKEKNSRVFLEYVSITGIGEALMQHVKSFYEAMSEFMLLCKWLSLDPSLVQGKGGNISVKTKEGMIVKASGATMGDVNLYHGFSVCDIGEFPVLSTEKEYVGFIQSLVKSGSARPSMETGFHAMLPHKTVVHTHPVHLNAILCSMESKTIIDQLFSDLSYTFVEYTPPGLELVNRISTGEGRDVIFLENHGLIVGAETAQEAFETTEKINNRCKRWLGNHVESFVDVEEESETLPLFPDAAVFPVAMTQVNNYILHLMNGASLTPRYLSKTEIGHLNNMILEKHRKAIA